MSEGRGPRATGACAVTLAALLLSACAATVAAPQPAADSPPTDAPAPHALARPRALRVEPTEPSVPAAPAAPAAPAFEFVKPDESAVDGIVVAPDGEPVAGALVLVQTDVTWPMPRTVRACTGSDGRFRVAAPRDKRAVLRFVTPKEPRRGFRYPVERVQVEAGGAKDLIVRLRAGETIAGRVVDGDGHGVAGLRLRTGVPPAMSSGDYVAALSATAADGSFAFDGLPSGFATLVEERADGSVAEHALLDAERVPTGTDRLLVRRMPLGVVSGRVEAAEGGPVAKRTIVLARKGEAFVVEARTDTAGRFSAKVAAPGRYVVRLRVATQSGHWDRDIGELDAPDTAERAFVAPAAGD